MLANHEESLLESLASAMEVMAFVGVAPLDDSPRSPSGLRILTMPFTGKTSGVLEIAAPPEFGRVLAANVMACSPEDPAAESGADDALKELLNITSGLALNRLSAMLQDEPEMALPQMTIDTAPDAVVRFQDGSTWIEADGHPVGIRLRMNA